MQKKKLLHHLFINNKNINATYVYVCAGARWICAQHTSNACIFTYFISFHIPVIYLFLFLSLCEFRIKQFFDEDEHLRSIGFYVHFCLKCIDPFCFCFVSSSSFENGITLEHFIFSAFSNSSGSFFFVCVCLISNEEKVRGHIQSNAAVTQNEIMNMERYIFGIEMWKMWNDLNKSICVENSSKLGDDKMRGHAIRK